LATRPDPELFSAGMARLLSDESLGITLGHKARCTITERFSAERMVANTIHVYEDVLSQRARA
jgi:glycosyltransferase involved in cell wall biosynthesis